MERTYFILTLAMVLFLQGCTPKKQKASNDVAATKAGLYFGLEPPGMESKPLALDVMFQEGWELGGVTAPGMKEFYLITSSDGKYLSYCPRCKPPYDRMWVDAQIIEDLRPTL